MDLLESRQHAQSASEYPDMHIEESLGNIKPCYEVLFSGRSEKLAKLLSSKSNIWPCVSEID